MKTCPTCKKEVSEETKFCDVCGTQISETIFCPNCGKQTSTESAFCQNCGASVTESTEKEPSVSTLNPKKKLPMKAILFGGIGVAVVAVLIIIISLLAGSNGKSQQNYALYLKDKEIFISDLMKDSKAWQLTSKLVNTDTVLENKNLAESGSYLGFYTYVSEDGKYIFFPDKVGDDDGFNLYYRPLNDLEANATKVDSNISSYTVNSSATIITYLKGEERTLYQYEIKDDSKDKIASEVRSFKVSDDGKTLFYINSENSIYLKYADKDQEKIASEVSSLEYVTDDYKTLYYVKDNSLYKQTIGKDKVKIASDVYDVLKIYDSGELYYLSRQATEISLIDYVIDDMKDADKAMSEPTSPEVPESPQRPYSWNYDSKDEYNAAYAAYEEAYSAWETEYDKIITQYYDALAAYNAKATRDELRTTLAEQTMDRVNYSLHFYNGTKETVITDAFARESYTYDLADDASVICYEAYDRSVIKKVKISEIESIYDVREIVEDSSSSMTYIAVKEIATVVEPEKGITNFTMNSSGTLAYYIDNIPNDKNHGELYRISISNGVVKKPEVYDSDVYTGYSYFASDSEFVYFKDYKDSKGELYINKEKIDYDVAVYSVDAQTDLDMVFYFTDWNDEKNYGTLKVYQNKKATKIADDVYDYSVTPDGRVLYLDDYSMTYFKGELNEWNNGKTRKIDDDVIAILPIFTGRG